jgi:hypothetical protein
MRRESLDCLLDRHLPEPSFQILYSGYAFCTLTPRAPVLWHPDNALPRFPSCVSATRCCSTGRIEGCNKLGCFSSVFRLLERAFGVGWTALRGEVMVRKQIRGVLSETGRDFD